MPDLLQQAAEWQRDQMVAHLSRSVTYHQGQTSVVVQAVLDKTNFVVETSDGLRTNWNSRDYLVRPGDLVLGTVPVVPALGDWIQDGGERYDVTAPPGAPLWKWEAFETMLRIHTKQG